MLNMCGKTVDILCAETGKKCVRLYTVVRQSVLNVADMWVQIGVIPRFIPRSSAALFTVIIRKSPLYFYQLYPLSTAPITRVTK